MGCVLIVDDDKYLRTALKKNLIRRGLEVIDSGSAEDAISILQNGYTDKGPVDVCVLDLKMPQVDGLEVLRRTQGRPVPVVVLTGHGSVNDAVSAMQLGAQHFIQKPVDSKYLWQLLIELMKEGRKPAQEVWFGESNIAQQFFQNIQKAAQVEEPVLLIGETGVGKKLAARLIHELGKRATEPLHTYRATGLDGTEASLSLFGEEAMATYFSGEYGHAYGGTLFIEEIAEMPLKTQGQLLNVLEKADQEKNILDDNSFQPPRLILSTRYDLLKRVKEDSFRPDLFYRLGVLPLVVPPLRTRGDDVISLARHWLARLGLINQKSFVLHPDAEATLKKYTFPGNIRELINVMKRLVVFATSSDITQSDVLQALDWSPFNIDPQNPRGLESFSLLGNDITLAELEKKHIEMLLAKHTNVSEVAKILGVDRRTLQRKTSQWNLKL